MANIFISHSSKDNEQTKEIFSSINEVSKSIFLDFDSGHGLKGGDKWEKELYVRVKKARIMIVALSPNWLNSQWCYKEYCMARVLRKKIIPVVITPDGRIRSWDGNDIQHFDVTFDGDAMRKLQERVRDLTHSDITKIYDINKLDAPFVGLRSFNKEEAGIFYGRNEEILDAIDKLNGMADTEHEKFLNIIGASGVGKSSFLKAGILPLLELLHTESWYLLPTFRAKQEILLNFAKTFSFAHASTTEVLAKLKTQSFKSFFDELELTIHDQLKKENIKTKELKILLPIDQAEELLSSNNQEEKEHFFEILRYLLEEKSNFFVVWTLRSDHLKRYQDEAILEFLHQKDETLLLQPIASSELKTIIQEPAYSANIHIEEAVVEQIKEDIRSTTSLPLLAYLLQILYTKAKTKQLKQITLNDYQALSANGKNPVENIINEEANKILKRVKDEKLMQELFLNHLISVNSNESINKQSAKLSDIPTSQQAIVEQFVEKRLFVKDNDQNDEVRVEIAHEALISSWEKLVGWIEEEKEFLLFRNHLKIFYGEWVASKRDKRALLKDLNLDKAMSFKEKLVDVGEIGFVEESFEYQELMRKKRRNFLVGVGGVISSLGAFSAFKWVEADKAKTIATKKTLEVEQEIVKTKNMLYDATMERGFIYRDYQLKLLEAKHTFARAVGQSNNGWQEKHSKIAYKKMNDGVKLQSIFKHGDMVGGVEISKDEQEILSWSSDGTVKLWSRTQDKPLLILKHDNMVLGAKFSHDETEIFTWSLDGMIKLWSRTSSIPLLMLKHNKVDGVTFSQDKKEILSWGGDGTLKLWSNTNSKPLLILKHDKEINGAKFSKDEKEILSWSSDGTVKLWSKSSDKPLIVLNHDDSVWEAKFSEDEKKILSLSGKRIIKLWSRIHDKPLFIFKYNGIISEIQFSRNEAEILSLSRVDGTIQLWNIGSKQPLLIFKYRGITGMEFSQNEKEILSWSRYGTVKIWSIIMGKLLFVLKHDDEVLGAKFSKDEKEILSWSKDGIVKLCNRTSDKPLLVLKHKKGIVEAKFSKDEKKILSWSDDGTLKFWSRTHDKPLLVLKHDRVNYKEKFTQDEKEILSWSDDGTVKLWSRNSDKPLLVLKHDGVVNGATFSQDKKEILSWSTDGTVKLWSRNSNKPLLVLQHDNFVLGAIFSQNEKEVLSWSYDGIVKLWSRNSNKSLLILKHTTSKNLLRGAQLSKDEKEILSWSRDGIIKLWSRNNDNPLLILNHNTIIDAKFNKDETEILSWSNDGIVKSYKLYRDRKLPISQYPLETQVEMGTELTQAGELRCLSKEEWMKKKRAYEKILEQNNKA